MKTKRLTCGEAIRAFCIECMGGDVRMPRDCTVTRCARWICRNGVEEAVPTPGSAGPVASLAATPAADRARAA